MRPVEEVPNNLTVIIPAYNEAEAIGPVVTTLLDVVKGVHVLVVDDGSTDDTAARAEAAGAKVIRHSRNRGYGAGITTGIRSATTGVVALMDADGQHDPADIPRLLEDIDQFDMVVGARNQDSHRDWGRRPGKFVLSKFANFLAKEKIPDVNSGLRAFRREVILRYLHLMPEGFSFSTTSTFAMLKGDHRIKWIPITVKKRVGASTVRQLKHGPQVIMLMLRLTVLFDPLRVFLPVSGLLLLIAFGMTVANMIFFRFAVPATAVLLAVSSVMVFMMSLLTDQVSAMRRERNG